MDISETDPIKSNDYVSTKEQEAIEQYAHKLDGFMEASFLSRMFFYWSFRIVKVNS